MKTIKLSDIKILKCFENSNPNTDKIRKRRDYWDKNHEQERILVLDKNNVLMDGYIQYLILKENEIEEARYIRRNAYFCSKKEDDSYRTIATTYVYGKHYLGSSDNEFVWRVPKTWANWADYVQSGDIILCSTKYGYKLVVVSRIEVLNECPVDRRVKRVASKEIRRNGKLVKIE